MSSEFLLSRYSSRVMRKVAAGAVILGALGSLAGCANPNANSDVYTYGQVQREQIARLGTIVAVRPITLQTGQTSGVGVVAGGVAGGVVGSAIGRGAGNGIAIVGGAILGALAGNAIENQSNKQAGLELTVRLDNGETVVIAQGADTPFGVGQRVQVISGAGPVRVAPL